MYQLRLLGAFVFVAAGAGLLSGCGSSLASVSGEATYDGKAVAEGYITFTPTDGKGKDAGGPITNGRYQVSDVPPGKKVVKVIGTKKVSFASTSEEMKQKAAEAQKTGDHSGLVDPADVIPDNAEGNNAQIELKAGKNTHDFHQKKPGKKG